MNIHLCEVVLCCVISASHLCTVPCSINADGDETKKKKKIYFATDVLELIRGAVVDGESSDFGFIFYCKCSVSMSSYQTE